MTDATQNRRKILRKTTNLSEMTRQADFKLFVLTCESQKEMGGQESQSSLMSRSEDLSVKGQLSRVLNLC